MNFNITIDDKRCVNCKYQLPSANYRQKFGQKKYKLVDISDSVFFGQI